MSKKKLVKPTRDERFSTFKKFGGKPVKFCNKILSYQRKAMSKFRKKNS